jgi:dihydrofolate synthase/folylpolyglutamate synthase
MNYPDSVRFLYALGNESRSMKLGLERMRDVCEALGHPERGMRFVHVAGTNGKGSVCAMTEAALRASGLRTGLYTSPHLISPTERIRVAGAEVDEATFARAFNAVHTAVRHLPEHPTYFETITAMAFVLFREMACDIAVLEVGLGGRLDATNVVTPQVCAITPVSYDHQRHLGYTLPEIATEKAGILKPGVPAAIAPQAPEAMEAIARKAREVGAPLHLVDPNEPLDCQPSLLGRHQLINARTAREILRLLATPEYAIRAGIEHTDWPGRLERMRREPEIFLDGAHNQAGAEALADFIREYRGDRRVWIIFGVMRDKDIAPIARVLFPLASQLILTAPHMDRAMPPSEIPAPANSRVVPGVADALHIVDSEAAPGDLVFITGSLFLVGEARAILAA